MTDEKNLQEYLKCYMCNNNADYLIESDEKYDIVDKIIRFFTRKHSKKRPICAKHIPYICWTFKLYTLNGELINGFCRTDSNQSPVQWRQELKDELAEKNNKDASIEIRIDFVKIPTGEYDMGLPESVGRYDDEGPVHHVTISEAFYLCKYLVTQKQWYEVMGNNPSYFKGDDLPVENVSWDDVQEFIKKLNEKEGTDKYRLPSEAEWEYACRAGTTTRYSFGDDDSELGECAWYSKNSCGETHPVYQKKPNPWGLYDMHGNVFEWVQDRWHRDYDGAPTNGSVWEDGVSVGRVNRGGGWRSFARSCQSVYRQRSAPGNRYPLLGFRLVKEE